MSKQDRKHPKKQSKLRSNTPDEAPNVSENTSGTNNPDGRPPKRLCFTDALRRELTKKKKFRKEDGSIIESSELDLIALKVIRELRTSNPVNAKLLEIVLNRLEGKPQESVTIDGRIEAASGISARDILLQRLDRVLSEKG